MFVGIKTNAHCKYHPNRQKILAMNPGVKSLEDKDACEPGMFCVNFKDQKENKNVSANANIENDSTLDIPKELSKLMKGVETKGNKTKKQGRQRKGKY